MTSGMEWNLIDLIKVLAYHAVILTENLQYQYPQAQASALNCAGPKIAKRGES